jgi:hypothetical protein
MDPLVPVLMVVLLGAYHGLNPAMGWLFAVALGLQERRRGAVIRALGPIALGHAASITVVVVVIGVVGVFISDGMVRIASAGVLVAFGLYKLLAPLSHPRWVGMRVNARDLVTWSFLMATAHGAGIMLIPLILGRQTDDVALAAHGSHADHVEGVATVGWPLAEMLTVLLHTAAMFVMMGVVAIVVYEKLGLTILRRAWFNVDRIWALMLFVAAGVTLVR